MAEQTPDERPDLVWCPSLGPLGRHGEPWRCVLDLGHPGPHASASDPTWSTAEETGRVAQEQLQGA